MGLAFGPGVGDEGAHIEPLGVPQNRARDIDRVVKGKLADDTERGVVGAGQSPCELDPGRQFYLLGEAPDRFAKNPDLVLGKPSGNQQIGRMPQRPQTAFSRSAQDGVVKLPQK